MTIKHLVYIPFTGLGLYDGFRGQEWFDSRAKIFEQTALKSLSNQTTKDFTLWVSFRKEEETNPTTKKIEEAIKKSGLKYIFTFDGIMMHDDRGVDHNKDLKERMARSMKTLSSIVDDTDWVYKTEYSSDDMLSEEALEEIRKEKTREKGATYYLNGYIHELETGRLAYWNRDSSCSKYTVMYPPGKFLDADKHLEYVDGLQSHEFLPIIMDATKLPDGRYCCTVHGWNISTGWNNSFRGDEIYGEKKLKILKKFGL